MLKTIVVGSLLHDVGKLNIDDSILKKDGKLTDEEYCQIQKHPELSIELLQGKEFPWDAKPIILHHHERLDGSGYPSGLAGEDIPLGARIVCIADVFDALTSDRVYRKAFSTEEALDIMCKESGISFDPVLMRTFERMIHEGKADAIINADTHGNEMYRIWTQCVFEDERATDELQLVGN